MNYRSKIVRQKKYAEKLDIQCQIIIDQLRKQIVSKKMLNFADLFLKKHPKHK